MTPHSCEGGRLCGGSELAEHSRAGSPRGTRCQRCVCNICFLVGQRGKGVAGWEAKAHAQCFRKWPEGTGNGSGRSCGRRVRAQGSGSFLGPDLGSALEVPPLAAPRRQSAFFFFLILFIYLFLAVLGPHCCMRAFSSCCEPGLLFVAVRGLLIAVASLVAEHRL